MIIDELKRVENLPVLPEVVMQVQKLLNEDDGNFNDLAKLLEGDVTLSSAVLKTANSALFNYSGQRITDLSKALFRIGRRELEKIVLSVSVISSFPETEMINLRLLWEQAFVTSALVKKMCSLTAIDSKVDRTIHLSALFQKLGIIVMSAYFPETLQKIEQEMILSGTHYINSEKKLFKSNLHAEIGSTLLEMWKLSSDIFIPVHYHLSPTLAPIKYRQSAWLLNTSDAILSLISPSPFTSNASEERVNLLLQQCGIATENVSTLIELAQQESDKARSLLSIWGLGDGLGKLRSIGSSSLLRPI